VSEAPASGLERVFFGAMGPAAIDEWLASVVDRRLGTALDAVELRAGRIDGRVVTMESLLTEGDADARIAP
jgi:hypothetical protein